MHSNILTSRHQLSRFAQVSRMEHGGVVGDALLELMKAKKLASILGGAWHANEEEEVDTDTDERPTASTGRALPKAEEASGEKRAEEPVLEEKSKPEEEERKGSPTLQAPSNPEKSPPGHNAQEGDIHARKNDMSSSDRAKSFRARRRRSCRVRRPADGRGPGRRDPEAVAKAEAAAKLAAAEAHRVGVDPTWQLPTNVDYYADRAALLRELVKEMPPAKRLSFQTRVANARTKEAVESLLHDFAPRLECLVLPHARSRDIDLMQVKKDTARERVVLDGKELAFWGSPSDQPHSWYEELWANVEAKVMQGLLGPNRQGMSHGDATPTNWQVRETASVDNARMLASEEWNKARAVATTSEVFKAMSRTGAGGDAYFALVALFCTADKMVVPVHCQESPITVEFRQPGPRRGSHRRQSGAHRSTHRASTGSQRSLESWHGSNSFHDPGSSSYGSRAVRAGRGGGGGAWTREDEEDVRVVVTVPSTFDIYLRDGAAPDADKQVGRGVGGQDGRGAANRRNGVMNGDHGGTDASIALHLVRVKAIVEEDIRVLGSSRIEASMRGHGINAGSSPNESPGASTPPTLRFLLSHLTYKGLSCENVGKDNCQRMSPAGEGRNGHSTPAASTPTARSSQQQGKRQTRGEDKESAAPVLALTRTERRMRVMLVPEPNAVSEMVRQISNRIGVSVQGPEPPRVLGS